MKAMILAAGRGERLRPLTDEIPKPLIKAGRLSLIEYHINNLVNAGIDEIIINTAWLAEKIHQQLGDGSAYGVDIKYSDEGEALETAGGILKALPLLGGEPFIVINGDIWCNFDFSVLTSAFPALKNNIQAHLILVNNPEHNIKGDFSLQEKLIRNSGKNMYTFSGIGIYRAEFFSELKPGAAPLAPIIRQKCEHDLVSGEIHDGSWTDVGTIERLQQLNKELR